MSLIDEIREMEKKLPSNAVADWQDTNHFELSGMINGEYQHAWLSLSDCLPDTKEMPCDTEYGKQIGLILDALVLASKMAQALIAADNVLRRSKFPGYYSGCDDEEESEFSKGKAEAFSEIRKAMEQGK